MFVDCVLTSPISFEAKEIGDVCTQARMFGKMSSCFCFVFEMFFIPCLMHHLSKSVKRVADCTVLLYGYNSTRALIDC